MPAGGRTAPVTPCDADGAFDEAAMRASIRRPLEAGAAGLCAPGGTGAPLPLSLAGPCRTVDTVAAEAGGRVPATVGCLPGAQADIIAVARHAARAGAGCIMLAPPFFVSVRPFDIERRAAAAAEACGLPVILCRPPSSTGRRPSGASRRRRATYGAPEGFAFMQGLEELLLPSLATGAAGGLVSPGARLPRSLRALFDHAQAGGLEPARRLQRSLPPLCRWLYSEPDPGPLEYALQPAGRPAGPCRPPGAARTAATPAAGGGGMMRPGGVAAIIPHGAPPAPCTLPPAGAAGGRAAPRSRCRPR